MTDAFEALGQGRFDEVLERLAEDPSLAKAANAKGSTLLMGAAMKGHVALFERLISCGADVNAVRAPGITALRFAVEQKQVALAERLLALGASAGHDERPYDLVRFALNSGPALAVKLLQHGLRLDVPHTDGEPLLFALVERANLDAVRAYVSAGGSLDVKRGKTTPVEVAARVNKADVVEYLVANGANPARALKVALQRDAVEVIALLAATDPRAVVTWLGDLDVQPVREALATAGVALPASPRGRLLSTAEAAALFATRGVSLEQWWPHAFTEGRALLLPGGTRLDSLELDFGQALLGREIKAGVIVDGDLTIGGALHNDEGDFGPFLVVLGTLTVKNVAIAGAPLHVEGDLEVENFHGFYNHGSTRVEGALDAGLFIAQDYGVTLNGAVRGDVVEVRGHITSKQRFEKRDAADVLAPGFLGDEAWPNHGAIAKALVAGKPIRK